MIDTRSVHGRAGIMAAVTVAAVATVALPGRGLAAPTTSAKPVHVTAQAAASSGRWLTEAGSLTRMAAISQRDALHFFNSANSFVLGKAVSGYAAAPVAGFRSYQKFAQAVGQLHSGQWVMYDNEHWSHTPVKEQRDPAAYMRRFAQLAHRHGLKVIEAPARDLMSVPGGDCIRNSGQTTDQAYLACDIPKDARYADIYEIQAQADQPTASSYTSFVKAARRQALRANSHLVLLAGLTTDRGGSATQILACWKATHKLVAGYWMNTNAGTIHVAVNALTRIHRAGG
jgi:hypothetical protein